MTTGKWQVDFAVSLPPTERSGMRMKEEQRPRREPPHMTDNAREAARDSTFKDESKTVKKTNKQATIKNNKRAYKHDPDASVCVTQKEK